MLFDDEPGDDPRLRSRACLWRPLLLSLSAEFASKHCSRKIPGGLCSIDTSGMGDGRSGPGAEPHPPSAKLDASVSARYILLMTFRI